MKHLLVIVFSLVMAACEPQDRRPGTWTSGEIMMEPVTDWSFSNDHMEVFLQTHPWYGIPHSVTTVLATTGDALYVPSIYYGTDEAFPDGKYWNRIVVTNPNVFVKIGDNRYPRMARLVTDEDEFEIAFKALAGKYEFWQQQYDNPAERPTFYILRLHDLPEHSVSAPLR